MLEGSRRAERWIGSLTATILVACDGGPPTVIAPEAGIDLPMATSSPDPDAAPPDGAPADGSEDTELPTITSSVMVGVMPMTASERDGGPTVVESTVATMDVLAAGSRSVTIAPRWDEIWNDATTIDDRRWSDIATTADLCRDTGCAALFSLVVSDHRTAARPAGLASWDAATQSAAERAIDRVYSTFEDELAYVTIGTAVDRYLATLSGAERTAFVAFVDDLASYARSHDDRPPDVEVGVALSLDAVRAPESDEVSSWIAASESVFVIYHPLATGFSPWSPLVARTAIEALFQSTTPGGNPPRVVFQEVGYPAAESLVSSERAQSEFFSSFFGELADQSEHISFAGIFAATDPPPSECERYASSLGSPGDPSAEAARCSMGLRHRDGTPKAAWSTVLNGLARFASP